MYSIHHQLLIAAPLQQVYRAITSVDGLSHWWTPRTELLSSGAPTLRFHFGNGYFKDMIITGQRENTSFHWKCVAGDPEWIGTTLSFELIHDEQVDQPEMKGQVEQAASDRGVVLRFQHTGWRENTPNLAECSYTWAMFLKSLKLYCETGVGKPWPGQHK
ncbi:SRPBCC domain-containing protein [Chitinophaga horti]|uniref:SRPBCC domain-containing protein n=1 Tax=Chitinophaga horti TaxID=2920382 RepID=A0ABY6J9J2_9BACT|nr:SRPBCC domain-containing protein [Chitinophaga horti]UYQ94961.1 SRPBCC domain-containing protein [Chitinophaga horti]